MNSHNHPMFGSVGAWFYQALGGITPETPCYERIRIAPQIVRDLTSVSATVETVRGTISSSWSHMPGTITLEVAIPVNSTATVVIPKDNEATDLTLLEGDHAVWENGKFVPGTPGITGTSQTKEGNLVIEVGSGRYAFKLDEK